jgi:hypothetical protein
VQNSKSFKKWLARIEDTKTPWTEKDIIYFRKAVGRSGLKDRTESALLISKFEHMLDNIGGYRITREQDEKGRVYLLDNSVKKNGQLRKHNKLGQFEINVLRNLDFHFFCGLHQTQAYYEHYLPVYRAVAKDGSYFEYIGAMYFHVEVLDTYKAPIRKV